MIKFITILIIIYSIITIAKTTIVYEQFSSSTNCSGTPSTTTNYEEGICQIGVTNSQKYKCVGDGSIEVYSYMSCKTCSCAFMKLYFTNNGCNSASPSTRYSGCNNNSPTNNSGGEFYLVLGTGIGSFVFSFICFIIIFIIFLFVIGRIIFINNKIDLALNKK